MRRTKIQTKFVINYLNKIISPNITCNYLVLLVFVNTLVYNIVGMRKWIIIYTVSFQKYAFINEYYNKNDDNMVYVLISFFRIRATNIPETPPDEDSLTVPGRVVSRCKGGVACSNDTRLQ